MTGTISGAVPPNKVQREFIFSHVGYKPLPRQWAIHLDDARFKLVIGGERGGKSLTSAMELLCWLIGRDGLFWIVGPDYLQTRKEFSYVLDALRKIGAVNDQELSFPKVGACSLKTVFGSTVITRTADDVRKLAGDAPDGILLVEGAQCTWETWMKLRGRVAEKRGWLLASGTLEAGTDWYPSLWERWQAVNGEGGKSYSLPTWENLAIFPGGRDDPELKAIEATLPADLFLERYGAVPCPPAGLVFREFSYQDHVREIVWRLEVKEAGKHENRCKDSIVAGMKWPIEIAVDPGYDHAYAVLALTWQGDQVLVFDEVYERGRVAEDVIKLCREKWWFNKIKGGVIDVAGTQHPAAKSQQEIWRAAAGLHLRTSRVGIVDGILRTRTFLVNPATGAPRMFISPKCKGLLAEMRKYRYHKDAANRPASELPIDRDNDSCKCLAYWLYDRFGPVARQHRRPQPGENPFADAGLPAREVDIMRGKAGVRFGMRSAREQAAGLSFQRSTP